MASPQQPHSCLHHVQGWCDSVRNPKPPFFFPAEVSSTLKAFKLKLINPTTHFPSQTPEHFLNTKVTATKSHCGLANRGELTSRWFQLKRFASRLQQGLGAHAAVAPLSCGGAPPPCSIPTLQMGKTGQETTKEKEKPSTTTPTRSPRDEVGSCALSMARGRPGMKAQELCRGRRACGGLEKGARMSNYWPPHCSASPRKVSDYCNRPRFPSDHG